MEILIGVAAFIILLILIICIGYVKAPPDTAYMISGFRKPRILIGKAGIRIPFLERLDKLSLKMFSVDVKTTDFVPNAEYINVKVDATVKIRIGQSEEMMSLASKFFLNESEDMIIRRVQDTLEGNMREIVGQMKLEEMVTDRKAFGERVQENAIPDLQKMGLEMISFNVQSLRNQHEMSQGDLAEKMNVSRQSISKWETDTSVPELDKLIQLSEVFHITLDELVKGDTTPEHETSENTEPEYKAPPQPVQVEIQKSSNTQKIVGIILLCFGALVLLLLTVLGGVLSGLLFSSPFILCGIVCLVFKRNAGLWCAWALLFAVNIYLRYATGIRWSLVLLTPIYEPSMNYMRLAFAWIELICYVAIVIVTVMRFRNKPLDLTKNRLVLLAAGCVALALTYIPVTLGPLSTIAKSYYIFADWVRLVLLTIILTNAVRLLRSRRNHGATE